MVVVVSRPQRRRLNLVIGGVEVEMFLNPLSQMRRYFDEERASGRPVMPHMCATGRIAFDPAGVMVQLQTEARAILDDGPPPLSVLDCSFIRYRAADALRDVDDVLEGGDPQAALLIGVQVPILIDHHYRIQRRWIVKRKRLLADLRTWDTRAADLVDAAVRSADPVHHRRHALSAFTEHVLVPIGGQMPLAWSTDWDDVKP